MNEDRAQERNSLQLISPQSKKVVSQRGLKAKNVEHFVNGLPSGGSC